ncbi:MAG: SUMF1/EgtB/PvdO family nonheme iron enzyme [Planctomycetes bacterium]|nr:SUMF1/EgtB/PvdO family nonheme iron enzyme [Planctomycetota bacterium]
MAESALGAVSSGPRSGNLKESVVKTPEERVRREDAVERAVQEYQSLLSEGRAPDIDEFCGCRAELDPDLRDRLISLVFDGAETRVTPPSILDWPRDGARKILGDFRILREIGRGGMGVVYAAEQISLHRIVALKVLSAHLTLQQTAIQRFHREALLAARLRHDGIVEVLTVGEQADAYYFAMEFIEGSPLDKVIAKIRSDHPTELHGTLIGAAIAATMQRAGNESGLDERRREYRLPTSAWNRPYSEVVCRIIVQVAEALDHAHLAGVIHRDVKPSNILIKEDGTAVLTDFGLARETGLPSLTYVGEFAGTPYYVSPEQALAGRSKLDHRTDIYSLGVTLFELLTLEVPFNGDSIQEVLGKIVAKEPQSPKKLNPLLPGDLVTIVLKAIEKDPDQRYCSAGDLASDLQAFLEYRPIAARSSGPLTRIRKWARRNPLVAILAPCAVFAGLALGTGYYWSNLRTIRRHLSAGEEALRAHRLQEALSSVDRALEHDASNSAALDLRVRIEGTRESEEREQVKRAALEAAGQARAEAARTEDEYTKARAALETSRSKVAELRRICFSYHAPSSRRAELSRREDELRSEDLRIETLVFKAREALEQATRLEAAYFGGAPSPETKSAFAAHFIGQWRVALDARDPVRETLYASEVRLYDSSKTVEAMLLGRGTLSVALIPESAQAYLFRYEPYDTVRTYTSVVSRLVPVPTCGVGRCRIDPRITNFYPGDLCLLITAVEPDSLASRLGLQPGDLVIRLNGEPCGDGLFLETCVEGGAAAKARMEPFDRIDSLYGESVEGWNDWQEASSEGSSARSFRFVANGKTVEITGESPIENAAGILVQSPATLVKNTVSQGTMRLLCLHEGVPVELSVTVNESSGLTCDVTAYPLIASTANRVPAGQKLEIDPGSYVLLVRAPGFEDQRYPIVVPRSQDVSARISLLPIGTTPPGFVFVSRGRFIYGDSEAFGGLPSEEQDLPAFFIGRREVTNQEWFEFVNDEALNPNNGIGVQGKCLPRQSGILLTHPNPNGTGYQLDWGSETTPILGIGWSDIQEYLAWRNRKAEATGEKWRYALPSDREWEKAARGVDGRIYPWGDRFDFSLAVSQYRASTQLFAVPGRFEPCDESPFGVADMAGSRSEWTAEMWSPDSGTYTVRGGSWGSPNAHEFRCGTRNGNLPGNADAHFGFRLVARPNP